MTYRLMTLNITTISIKTLKIIGIFATLRMNDTQHNITQDQVEYHNAECRVFSMLC